MRVRGALLAVAVLAAAIVVVFRWPARDTTVGHWLNGDLSRSDAISQCASFLVERTGTRSVAKIFDGTTARYRPHHWSVTGTLSSTTTTVRYACTLSWTPGPSTVHLDDLRLTPLH